MATEDTDILIINEVERHYQSSDSPYDLGALGKFVRDSNIEIPEGVQLKDYLKSRFHERFVIVQNPNDKVKIAIATHENRERVEQQLLGQDLEENDLEGIEFSRLPFALVAAFCKVPDHGKQLFFRRISPFRYVTRLEAPDDTYVEIEEQYQPSSLRGADVHTFSEREKHTVYEHILQWAKAKSIDLRTLYFDRPTSEDRDREGFGKPASNALHRLISAQPPAIRDKLRIPADIANILMRFR